MTPQSCDVAVVGGGPAGLSAALWLARHRCTVVVVDDSEPRNRFTEAVHGYLGMDPVAPTRLVELARADLAAYRTVEIVRGRVASIEPVDDRFVVRGAERPVDAARIVLATGVRDAFPEVLGFADHYGRSVFHCPTCDGYEARGKRVVVLGWEPQVSGFALSLLNWATDVKVVTQGRSFEADAASLANLRRHGVEVVEDEATTLVGEPGALRAVRLQSGDVPCELAFFSIHHEPVAQLAHDLGCRRDAGGYVVVDDHGQTTRSGVYAAGDLTPGLQLVQVAAAKGTTAGVSCALSLRLPTAAGER